MFKSHLFDLDFQCMNSYKRNKKRNRIISVTDTYTRCNCLDNLSLWNSREVLMSRSVLQPQLSPTRKIFPSNIIANSIKLSFKNFSREDKMLFQPSIYIWCRVDICRNHNYRLELWNFSIKTL